MVDDNNSTTDGWSYWDDMEDDSTSAGVVGTPTGVTTAAATPASLQLPPQLHPAVSLSVRRMSSCYFSISSSSSSIEQRNSSTTDLRSPLWDESDGGVVGIVQNSHIDCSSSSSSDDAVGGDADLLYHDILMNVFAYLDTKDLAAFSETARRSNFECFYFLQLQLQRALLLGCQDRLLLGVGIIARLATLDKPAADEVVQTYLRSNSTLCHMPLSHSLAYVTQFLTKHTQMNEKTASAALFLTLAVGGTAASLLSNEISFGSDVIPNMLFRVGFVGSLMGAARTMSSSTIPPTKLLNMAQSMQEYSHQVYQQVNDSKSIMDVMHHAYNLASGRRNECKVDDEHQQDVTVNQPVVKPPYLSFDQQEKKPSGCVGAYLRAISQANDAVVEILKTRRKLNFRAYSDEQRRQLSTSFIDSCCDDNNLETIKDMILRRECVDVEGFYVGSDGTEISALHASALHGAVRTLQFLCGGVDERDPTKDGGLASVNSRDSNGWTAMHFAAGANCVEACQILLRHGARVDLEALNGYTPLQWANRLQHDDVAAILREAEKTQIMRKPLNQLASRFFAFTHL